MRLGVVASRPIPLWILDQVQNDELIGMYDGYNKNGAQGAQSQNQDHR